jgi:transposase
MGTIEARLPQRNRLGRPPKTALRIIVNALLYRVRVGCQWRQLPREFSAFTTGQYCFLRLARRRRVGADQFRAVAASS